MQGEQSRIRAYCSALIHGRCVQCNTSKIVKLAGFCPRQSQREGRFELGEPTLCANLRGYTAALRQGASGQGTRESDKLLFHFMFQVEDSPCTPYGKSLEAVFICWVPWLCYVYIKFPMRLEDGRQSTQR